ncbi:Crp/Fnr family transcriptional regulator [Peloplasma aerotolerans]|uniref:Crp/Fnr family transcriptional regulator n=1 Tax=Peloplasma aerotolerans TaxID=3044389 RepID=A0AAW6UC25_9MOLU|nr:Crp/Fnr family transcriptional regulator [Mariniplasma sp. M4Ah]MDI6453046.1 Crp/Fnr family transcriptional regulator [Mariniplasma sp. M4Ah]
MKKNLEPSNCIKSVPIFKNLSEQELNQIIMISSHRKLEKGQFIFTAGDYIQNLYVIHQGKIKITRYTESGKEQVIRILSHGDFLGELALFNDSKVNTYAEVLEPAIVCLVEHKDLKSLMANSPTLSFKMLDELSNRLEKAEALIEHNNLYSAIAKVSKLLLDLQKNGIVRFHTTKVNLSSQIGITPETFSRKLKELEEQEYIDIINNKLIRIKDSYSLELLINPDHI